MDYDFDYFNGNNLIYPSKPKRPTLDRNATSIEARAYASALEEYERELKGYEEDRSFYNHEKNSRLAKLKKIMRDDYDLSESKFDYIWEEASNRANGEGLEETVNEFDRLYNFIEGYDGH